jgi:hypothetical protein
LEGLCEAFYLFSVDLGQVWVEQGLADGTRQLGLASSSLILSLMAFASAIGDGIDQPGYLSIDFCAGPAVRAPGTGPAPLAWT